jgi:hypothetical protein
MIVIVIVIAILNMYVCVCVYTVAHVFKYYMKREFVWRLLASVENCKQLSLLIFDKL